MEGGNMTTSRAAILPYPADPFLLNYWLNNYKKWSHFINKLYIILNGTIEKPAVEYIRQLCARHDNIHLEYIDHQIEHGDAINRALDLISERHIMLVEDDAFVIQPRAVNHCFQMVESDQYDVCGSKRGSCGLEILKYAKKKWGLKYDGEGDQGPNFWPCFFFTSKEIMLRTDRNFAAKLWKAGESIPFLNPNEPFTSDQASDTFVWASLQIRNIVDWQRIYYMPQYHAHPDDLDHYNRKTGIFTGGAVWTHIGSLSSGIGGVLRDEQDRALVRRTVDEPKGQTILPKQWCQTDAERGEWERRVQWWLTFWEHADPTPEVQELYKLYKKAIDRVIEQFGLDINRIKKRQYVYGSIGL